MSDIQVRIADWQQNNADLRRIRERVFVQEQRVPPEQEWDSQDLVAVHFLAESDGFAVGTARLLPDASMGRVAVLKEWRGLGIGDALIKAAIAEAERRGQHEQTLTAQVHAAQFYERLGFESISDEFIEAGIPHVEMRRLSQ